MNERWWITERLDALVDGVLAAYAERFIVAPALVGAAAAAIAGASIGLLLVILFLVGARVALPPVRTHSLCARSRRHDTAMYRCA